jgi:hypothetical protein
MKIYNHGVRLIALCSLVAVQSMYSELNVNLDSENVRLIKTLEMRFCYISFVEIDGEEYIVKQKKSDCQRKLVGVVRDAVMAHFSEGFINAHLVGVIPAGKEFVGKPRTDWPATIHTIAPGKMIKAQESPYKKMNIKQGEIGFRRDMLKWMLKHIIIMKMVAYDTFFCNHDRHKGNLFYDPKDKTFCAIDMDSSFRYNLCAFACENLRVMLDDRIKFSSKELAALVAFKGYLQFLIDNYSPQRTLKMYDYFLGKAGFVEGAEFYQPKHVLEVQNNKTVIMRSYEDAKRLVKILEKIIGNAQKRVNCGCFSTKN